MGSSYSVRISHFHLNDTDGFIGAVVGPLGGGDSVSHVPFTGPTALSHPLPPAVLSKPDLSQKADILTFKDRKFLILLF